MTPGEARAFVISRDGGCVTPLLDPSADGCRGQWGDPMPRRSRQAMWDLTVDRIRDHPSMGKAPSHSDTTRLVTVCYHHHLNGWATSHRPMLREYLRERNGG